MEKVILNNKVTIMGEIVSGFTFSHEIYGEGFYMVDVRCKRISGAYDTIPVMVSDRLMDVSADFIGQLVSINGQFRSYNRHEGEKTHLILSVFAREVEVLKEIEDLSQVNQIFLDGFICKEPVYRKTPLGREIADILLAVNRPYKKSDYIPCICWGRNARYVSDFQLGERICVWGRIQSREYSKKIEERHKGTGTIEHRVEWRTAYEVSVSILEEGTDGQK